MNSLTREKGDTKEFRRLVLCSFGKGRRETQKEFRQLVLGEFFLAKGEENEKMNITSFQGLENQKTSESFWQRKKKKEFKEIQKSIGKSSVKVVCKSY